MFVRSRVAMLTLATLCVAVSQLVWAGGPSDLPHPSRIVNNSSNSYGIRISDDAVPLGVVTLYGDKGALLANLKSKNDTWTLPPKTTVKMVVAGSPKLGDKIVGIHVSLDKLKDDKTSIDIKSASRLHFLHWQDGTRMLPFKEIVAVANSITNVTKDALEYVKKFAKLNLDPLSVTREADPLISLDLKEYQKADENPKGALWTIGELKIDEADEKTDPDPKDTTPAKPQ